jgi:hypothetical protein
VRLTTGHMLLDFFGPLPPLIKRMSLRDEHEMQRRFPDE